MSTWYITIKDLLLLTYDKQAIVLLLVLPLLLISIIGMSTGQFLTGDDEIERVPIAVVDQIDGLVSQSFVADLMKRSELVVTPMKSPEMALNALRHGEVVHVLVIGPKFEQIVEDARMHDIFNMMYETRPISGLATLDLKVTTKANAGIVGELLETAIFAMAVKFISPIAARKNAAARKWVRSPEEDLAAEKAARANAPKRRVSVVSQWVVPGFTVMFAYFLITVMALSFLNEREQGTLRRLMLAPVHRLPLLIGKTIPFYLTSVVQCALLFLCGRLLFGMPWGSNPLYLIPIVICTSASAASLGLLLSTIVRTDQQITSYGTALILVLSALSGCFLPQQLFPRAMKQISLVTPHAWSLKAFDAVLNEPNFDPQVVASSCAMLLLFSVTFFTVGWWKFRTA